jgi:hypothetical protein
MKTKEETLTRLFSYFVRQGQLDISEHKQVSIVALVGLIFTQAPGYCLLKGDDINDESYIHDSLRMVLFALQPYLVTESASSELVSEDTKFIDDLFLAIGQNDNQ